MKSLPREQTVRAEQAYFYAKYATNFLAELWFRNHKSGKAFVAMLSRKLNHSRSIGGIPFWQSGPKCLTSYTLVKT